MFLTKKKKLTIIFFFWTYCVLGVLLAYLLFFNSGLEIIEKEKQVFFKNNSQWVVKNITISVVEESGKKTVLEKIPQAVAGEEKIIDLKPLENFEEAVLAVEAPFYSPVTKLFVLAEKKLGLTYNFNYPSVIFSQTTFNFGLQACNELDMVRKVFVEIELDEEFLNSDKKFSQLTIPQKSCERTTYLLTPKKSGKTSVLFNIVVENNKETKSNTIEIV